MQSDVEAQEDPGGQDDVEVQGLESPKQARGCLGCGGCCVVGVVLLVLLAAVVFFSWTHVSARRVEEQLALIREAGEPTTSDDLEAFYPGTEAEEFTAGLWISAAEWLEGEAFLKAAEDMPIVGDSEVEIPPPGQPWSELEAVDAFLQEYADVLEQLHEAAASGKTARYPTDFSQGYNMRLDHVQKLRAAARMLALQAHVRAHRGDAHGAAESIQAMFALAESLKKEPILVSQLVRTAFDGMAQEVLQRQLPTVDFSKEDLDRMQAHLRSVEYEESMRRAMVGERGMVIVMMQNPADLATAEGLPRFIPRFVWNDNLVCYLEYMDAVIAASKKPMPAALDEAEKVDDKLCREMSGGSPLAKPGRMMASMLIPATGSVFEVRARSTASSRAVDAVIAVERFTRENGRLPKTLEELVPKFLPQVPADPYDGQPLRYVVRDGEYVIYSVGKNRADDGGQGNEQLEPDLVFPVQRWAPVED